MVQLELKADLNDVNESLGSKANKSTVANALHRKANKSEVEESLKEIVNKKELSEVLEQFQKETRDICANMISKEKEKLVKIDHFKELEDIILRKADKSEIDMYLSAVGTQKKDFDRRIELVEREAADILRSCHTEIESIRASCIETLNHKADILDIDRVYDLIKFKVDNDSVMKLLNEAKSDLYVSVNEIRDEFMQNRKKYEDGVYERASRAEVNSERCLEEIDKLKSFVNSSELNNNATFESVRTEMFRELKRQDSIIVSLNQDLID